MVVAAVTSGCGLDLVVIVVGSALVKTSEVILDFGFSLFGRDNVIDEFTLLGLGIGKECLVLRSVLLILEIDGPLERLGDGDLGGVVFVTLETYEINALDDARSKPTRSTPLMTRVSLSSGSAVMVMWASR